MTSARVGRMAGGTTRLGLAGWLLYDWANTAFFTVVQTFVFAAYFTRAVAVSETAGTTQWAVAITVAGLVVAVAGPVLGAVAEGRPDRARARRHGDGRLRGRERLLQRHAALARAGGADRPRLGMGLGRRLCRRRALPRGCAHRVDRRRSGPERRCGRGVRRPGLHAARRRVVPALLLAALR